MEAKKYTFIPYGVYESNEYFDSKGNPFVFAYGKFNGTKHDAQVLILKKNKDSGAIIVFNRTYNITPSINRKGDAIWRLIV